MLFCDGVRNCHWIYMQGGFKPFHVFGSNQTDLKERANFRMPIATTNFSWHPNPSHTSGPHHTPTSGITVQGGPHASVSSGDGEAETDGKGKKSESAPCHHFLAMERWTTWPLSSMNWPLDFPLRAVRSMRLKPTMWNCLISGVLSVAIWSTHQKKGERKEGTSRKSWVECVPRLGLWHRCF